MLPIDLLPSVGLVAEESVHFALDTPEAYEEWMHYLPPGAGVVRLGPENRAFIVGMFHELHCLQYLRDEVVAVEPVWPHVQHCMNLLRRAVLCDADTTLEPGDFTERDFTSDRLGQYHVCRDWGAVYDQMAVNWVEWWKYGKAHNITVLGKPKSVDAVSGK
ncbi:hypothetical protein B0F90DRAFT_1749919 [Multifurca ochricompacta]|uniref:Uncharacterized protein n=1 Tax=Multifurca ochricompacta TaxID=376703 RepID=A0AAD4LZL5_9AGAM|nr:hypothetical protein B0F90DRAFT_1749919 [Multifurca ochricompacta]